MSPIEQQQLEHEKAMFAQHANQDAQYKALEALGQMDITKPKLNRETKKLLLKMVTTLSPSELSCSLNNYLEISEAFYSKFTEKGETIKASFIAILSQKFKTLSQHQMGGADNWNGIKNLLAKYMDEVAKMYQDEHAKQLELIYKENPKMRQGSKIELL